MMEDLSVQDRQEKKWIKNSMCPSVIVNDYENRPQIRECLIVCSLP
jgi:hypothetical protein